MVEDTGPVPVTGLLERYPRLQLVIAHMGMPEYGEFLDLAERYERVHLDTTMFGTDFTEQLMPFDPAERSRLSALREKVLLGSQVFVKLPDQTKSCPRISAPFCASNKIPVWTRDADRCQMSAGCASAGACAQYVPTCDEFYDLVSWTGGQFACTQYACEPSWLHD